MKVPLWSLYRRIDRSGRPDLPLLSVYRDHGVVLRAGREDNYNKPGADLSRYKIVSKGDLVINKMKTWQGSLGVSAFDGIVSPAYFVAKRVGDMHDRFMHHLLRSQPLIAEYGARSKGIRPAQWDLPWEEFASIKVRLPHTATQRAIADYLDTETGRIDALITKKRRMIDLLQYRLVSLATQLVNGGDGEQKSGIPSIPYIPRQWKSLRNKAFMHEPNKRSKTGEEEMLSVSHLTGVTPRSEKTVYMFEAESTVGYKLVQPGDLAVNTMWAWMGAAGVSQHHGIVSPSYGVYRIDQSIVLPAYFDLLVRTPAYICEMTRYSRGVTSSRLRLYPDQLLALRTPVPPKGEQHEIIQQFEAAAEKGRSAIDALDRQVELLAERRQALITAAVSGKLPTPGVAA